MHQDPDRDIYTSDEEGTVVNNAAHELDLLAVSKLPTTTASYGRLYQSGDFGIRGDTLEKDMVC